MTTYRKAITAAAGEAATVRGRNLLASQAEKSDKPLASSISVDLRDSNPDTLEANEAPLLVSRGSVSLDAR
jgi:hypothetical protein